MGGPMVLLYELCILIAGVMEHRANRANRLH